MDEMARMRRSVILAEALYASAFVSSLTQDLPASCHITQPHVGAGAYGTALRV